MAGVDLQYAAQGGTVDTRMPSPDVFYADDTLILSLQAEDLQARFNILQELAAQVGLNLNKDKTVLILGKVKSKHTMGTACSPPVRNVTPFDITYWDGLTRVKIIDSEVYLGGLIGRFLSAKSRSKT